jgi:small GTP-binding protein
LRSLSYPDTDVFLVCFSIVSPTSFKNVKSKWIKDLGDFKKNVPIILVGTKLDLREDEEEIKNLLKKEQNPISKDEGIKLAEEIGAVVYMECSAKTQKGLKELFNQVVKLVIEKSKEEEVGKNENKKGIFTSSTSSTESRDDLKQFLKNKN